MKYIYTAALGFRQMLFCFQKTQQLFSDVVLFVCLFVVYLFVSLLEFVFLLAQYSAGSMSHASFSSPQPTFPLLQCSLNTSTYASSLSTSCSPSQNSPSNLYQKREAWRLARNFISRLSLILEVPQNNNQLKRRSLEAAWPSGQGAGLEIRRSCL